MRAIRNSLLVLSVAVLCAGPAMAQPPGGGRGGRGGMMQMGQRGGAAVLLANASVQGELKLTDEQKEKVKEFAAKQQEAMAKLRDLPQEERREKMQEMMKSGAEAAEKFVKEHLKPEQAKRLKQITLQQAGIGAFSMEDVAKELKITDEQKEKIKTLGEDMRKDMQELFQGGGNPQESMSKMAALRKEYLTKAAGALTDEQKAKWKDMVGAAFEVKMEQPRRPDRDR